MACINQALSCVLWQRRTTTPTTKMKFQKSCTGKKDAGPTCGITASPEVGPGATVGAPQTGYPCVQASSQRKEQDVQPRTTTCPAALEPASQPRWGLAALMSPPDKESSGTTKCTMALDPLGGLWCTTCPVALDPASLWGGLPRRVGSPVGHGPQARRKA
jgi:hypothetical protein